MLRILTACVFSWLVFIFTSTGALAQSGPSELVSSVRLPPTLPTLPPPLDESGGLVVDHSNVRKFNDVLVAPLSAWLEDSQLYLRAVRQLGFYWELGDEWRRASSQNVHVFKLDDENRIVIPPQKRLFGLPFGFAADIDSEKDPVRKAFKILYNCIAAEGASGDAHYGLSLSWTGLQSALRESSGVFYRRLYAQAEPPPQAEEEPKDKADEPPLSNSPKPPLEDASLAAPRLLQREVLKLFSPAVIYGYAQITHRYLGPTEDRVWIHSPVIGKNRRVLPTNRADALFGSALTMADLFVWSDKIEKIRARVVDEKVMLVPFASVTPLRMEEEDVFQASKASLRRTSRREAGTGPRNAKDRFEEVLTVRGHHTRRTGSSAMMLWNHETRRFPHGAAWVPTEAVFVPRRVWVIELEPKDPFSLLGRQVLIVDQESMLPVYKLCYDRQGQYLKTVIGGWALASGKNRRANFPFASFVLVVEDGGKKAVTMTTRYVRTYLGKEVPAAEPVRRLLEIENHEEQSTESEDAEEEEPEEPTPSQPSMPGPEMEF